MTRLSIIILNYNTKTLALKCLESIKRQYQTQLEKDEFEMIVVDNASIDGTPKEILKRKSFFPNLTLIENKKNYGFSKGNNLGARKAKGKYLLFLNSDTEILDQGFLGMIEFLEKNEKVGIIGGKLKNPDGSSQKSVGKFYSLLNVFLMLLGFENLGLLRESPKKEQEVDWASGACLMIKNNLFKKIGGFDENFFMYVEDMELCFRLKKNGFSTYFYPWLELKHKELGSSDKAFAILNIYKGLKHFYRKHQPIWQYNLLVLMLKSKALIAIIVGKLINKKLEKTYLEAYKVL